MDLIAEPKLKDFWYPVVPMGELSLSPISFTLLNIKIAIWLNENNEPCAVLDKCSHRGAELSKGSICRGNIVCPYHSWEFSGDGNCVSVPQLKQTLVPKSFKVRSFLCKEKYGHVWVCLGTPVVDIPEIPESTDLNYRNFSCFWETWNTSSMRVIENELDMAHFASVHKGTFGNSEVPLPLSYELKQLNEYSLFLRSELSVKAPPQQQKNTRAKDTLTSRTMSITCFMNKVIEKLEIARGAYPLFFKYEIVRGH
jgi:phenylpropionate dioxygenase-like ring-hydroxylating dioxygenase large terminal subunit